MPIYEEQIKNEDTEVLIQKNAKDPVMVAMFLVKEFPNLVRCNGSLYKYNSKCYDILSDKDIDEMFLGFCIKYGITKTWDKRISVLSAFAVYSTITKIEKMNDYDNLLNLNNGILNIHTREFIEHSPNYYFDSYINVSYDEKSGDCPAFMKYLNHTFNGDQDTIDNIIKLGGYLLDTSCAAKKMFMFNGPGGSGKSTLIDTYSMFFVESMDSKNQVTGLSLEELAGSGFDKALLINSRFNPCAETKKGYIDAEEIKKIISGDVIKVRQVYSEAVNFRPKTKIVVACNGLPKFTDTSDGIYRRLCTIEFTNQYKSPSDYARIESPELRRIYLWDSELMDKIREEKAAILNLFIDGLVSLKNNKYEFIDSEASTKALNEFKRDSDTVREFLEDNYELDMKSEVSLKEVFADFRYWYMENVQDTKSMKFRSAEMGKRIREVFGIDGGNRHSVYNPELKRSETTTMYHLRKKEPIIPVEEILTENQAMQRGLDF